MITELAQSIPVNGTEIAYREMGHGRPLVLLHGGLVSTSDEFAAWLDGAKKGEFDHLT